MSGKMLKAIRNAIVGMMNRLRMLMSLRPRLAAGEPGSSVLSTCALLLNPEPLSTGPSAIEPSVIGRVDTTHPSPLEGEGRQEGSSRRRDPITRPLRISDD